MASTWYSAPAPVTRRVRAYLAPVNRATATPTLFDPSEQGGFSLDNPPAPWVSLGWIQDFNRKSGSRTSSVLSGIPAAPLELLIRLERLDLDAACAIRQDRPS